MTIIAKMKQLFQVNCGINNAMVYYLKYQPLKKFIKKSSRNEVFLQ